MALAMNDYELLYMVYQKDEKACHYLVEKYYRLIWKIISSCINRYHPKGIEREDLYQEGLIALTDAIYSFRDDIQAPFFSFASICVERQIKTYIRRFNSHTLRQYYNGISLDMYISEDENLYLHDIIPTSQKGISFIHHYEDDIRDLLDRNNQLLNEFEKQVLSLKIQGYTYREIGEKLQVSEKSVDNCIQRIKQKTKNVY